MDEDHLSNIYDVLNTDIIARLCLPEENSKSKSSFQELGGFICFEKDGKRVDWLLNAPPMRTDFVNFTGNGLNFHTRQLLEKGDCRSNFQKEVRRLKDDVSMTFFAAQHVALEDQVIFKRITALPPDHPEHLAFMKQRQMAQEIKDADKTAAALDSRILNEQVYCVEQIALLDKKIEALVHARFPEQRVEKFGRLWQQVYTNAKNQTSNNGQWPPFCTISADRTGWSPKTAGDADIPWGSIGCDTAKYGDWIAEHTNRNPIAIQAQGEKIMVPGDVKQTDYVAPTLKIYLSVSSQSVKWKWVLCNPIQFLRRGCRIGMNKRKMTNSPFVQAQGREDVDDNNNNNNNEGTNE